MAPWWYLFFGSTIHQRILNLVASDWPNMLDSPETVTKSLIAEQIHQMTAYAKKRVRKGLFYGYKSFLKVYFFILTSQKLQMWTSTVTLICQGTKIVLN